MQYVALQRIDIVNSDLIFCGDVCMHAWMSLWKLNYIYSLGFGLDAICMYVCMYIYDLVFKRPWLIQIRYGIEQ